MTDVVGRLRAKELAVFDLDGTLYDDRAYLRAADHAIARYLAAEHDLSASAIDREIDGILAATGRHEFLTNLCKRVDLSPVQPDETIAGCLEVLRTVRPAIALFSWAEALLADLAAHDTRLAILTNGNLRQQMNKVDLLGIERAAYPVTVVYAVEHRQKPAPDGLFHALALARVAADRTAMVGNHEVDRLCALACGVDYVDVDELVEPGSDRSNPERTPAPAHRAPRSVPAAPLGAAHSSLGRSDRGDPQPAGSSSAPGLPRPPGPTQRQLPGCPTSRKPR